MAHDRPIALSLAGTLADLGARHARAGAARVARGARGRATGGAERTRFDVLDPDVLADPYPWYRTLLDGPPLHYSRRRGIWIVSHYEEVRAALRAHDALSSAETVTRYRARIPMLITMDRPEHARLRRLVARDFSHDALERWRPDVERLAREAVDTLLDGDECDAVARLASPFPVAVIAHVLGVPPTDLPDFREWSDRIVEGLAVGRAHGSLGSSVRVLGSAIQLHGYFREQFERRRRDPGPDVLSRLIASSEEGQLSDDELFWFCLMLLVAGNETTTSLLGSMMLAFAEHPEQYALVRDDPDLIPSAVEEGLRWSSPIQGLYRTASREYRLGDAAVPAGGRVLLLYGAANRDPRHYPEPDRFLVERNPSDHLAFGSGIHFCLGAHLARMEAAAVLRELVERVDSLTLAADPEWVPNPSLRRLERLRVRFEARRGEVGV